jgi:diacylglycerol O-acyltransferase
VSAMIAPLGTHIADPAERMAYVFEQTSRSKEMTNAIGARQMTEASKVSPALFMALGAQAYTRLGIANLNMTPVINTIVTNVPGPPVPIYSAGAKLVSMQGMLCLMDGVALGHVVQSYVKEATISFTADRKVMTDPEFYADCIQESFEEMAAAAGLDLSPSAPVAEPAAQKAPAKRKPAAKKPAAKKKTTTRAKAKA